MADVTQLTQSKGMPLPEHGGFFRSSVEADPSISIDKGSAVGIGEDTATVAFAVADSAGTAPLVGIAISAAEGRGKINVVTSGPVTLTTAQWDAVTGQSGGLTPKALYYVSTTTEGHLTTTRPVNNLATLAGLALSRTTLLVRARVPMP